MKILFFLVLLIMSSCALVIETPSAFKVIGWPSTAKKLGTQCSSYSSYSLDSWINPKRTMGNLNK